MGAELQARLTAAAAVLADYQRNADAADVAGRAMWAARLADMLGYLLAVPPADAGAGRLAVIRSILAAFDWETGDRQVALERIEQITEGSRTASGVDPGGVATLIPADLTTVLGALDAAAGCLERHQDRPEVAAAYRSLGRQLGGAR